MAKGSCACGEFTYEVTESPTMQVVCHCIPCQHFAGSNGSTNAVTSTDKYKHLTGTVSTWSRKGDSGKDLTNSYCSSCHNLVFVDADFMPGMRIYKTGTLDDKSVLDGAKVVQEIYTRNRPNCFDALQDVDQKEGQR